MENVKVILCLCCVYLQLNFVIGQISWENCNANSDIQLLNVTVKPYPITIPGSVSLEIGIRLSQAVVSPVKAELSLERKILFGYISVPCVSGIGSCTYADLCTNCPQCGCPLTVGDHILTLPIYIDTDSWTLVGNYQAQVTIKTGAGQNGCVKVNNVHIQSKS